MRGIADPPATVAVAEGARGFADAIARALDGSASGDAAGEARVWAERRSARFRQQLADGLDAVAR
jgi:uncharacterized protein YfiM (DUF2279 family)